MQKKKFNFLLFKELAEKKEITILDMVEKTGIAKSRIYKISSGHTKPKYSEVEKIAEILNIEMETLYESLEKNDKIISNPYKDALVRELKSEVNYLKKMIAYLTDGKVKDDLVKLEGSFKPTFALVPLKKVA